MTSNIKFICLLAFVLIALTHGFLIVLFYANFFIYLFIFITINLNLYKLVVKSEKKVVCYYTNWSQYRPEGAKFFPENIDPFLCTHVMYSFAMLDSNYQLESYEWNDKSEPWAKGSFWIVHFILKNFNNFCLKKECLKEQLI